MTENLIFIHPDNNDVFYHNDKIILTIRKYKFNIEEGSTKFCNNCYLNGNCLNFRKDFKNKKDLSCIDSEHYNVIFINIIDEL